MQFSLLTSVATIAAVASARSTITLLATVTSHSEVDVTITSCSEGECTTTVKADATSVVSTTVNGVATVYTTICPETESKSSAKPAAISADPATVSSSSEADIYVDVTSTPIVTVSTGVLSTLYQQSSFTTYYNGTASLSPEYLLENNGVRNAAVGLAGAVGLVAALL